ncbi:hypothetical protein PSQ90_14930 [Devosia rhodophyticola]|uniref:AlpA family phage regulatory protein n=1 Tax=Devosia rhodophyticola TaxID=3026423 RepID=A0ABY7YWD9_9HYPH|nr:hypothetical protein [Devosia rhodophyticola]WDR05551.1 hypothetical protein PSQ90_14930 [Devosia rhodophyticola]
MSLYFLSRGIMMDKVSKISSAKTFLSANQVRQRYGKISDMTLWRWLNDEALGFPKPMVIARRRFWLESDLDAFDVRTMREAS